jgi:hypothetical protein
MIKLIKIPTIFFLMCCSVYGHSSAFIDHGLSVSRAMASFYMFGVSKGDENYKREYEQYLIDADRQLLKIGARHVEAANKLKPLWDRLRPQLSYDYDEYSGYFVAGLAQGQFRQYLNTYYSEYKKVNFKNKSFEDRLLHTQINIEIMLARFFDLASAAFIDEGSMDGSEPVINTQKVAKYIARELSVMGKLSTGRVYQDNLRQIERKWNFIESSVVNSQKQPALLLVYYNKVRITKLIESSKKLMASN